jgi:cytoskeletal protein RodZ
MNKKKTLITAIVLIVIITLSLVGYTSCKKEPKPTKPTVTQPEVTTTVTKVEPTSTETEPLPTETTSVETEPVESSNVETTQPETSPVETTSVETDKPTEPTTKSQVTTTRPPTGTTVKPTEPKTTQPKPTTKQTEPKPTTTAHVHVYDIPIIEIVHHPEEGHSEMRKYCDCGIDITGWTEDEYFAHCKKVEDEGGFCSGWYNKNVYIIDKEAWDEEVIVGYKCACGHVKK